MTPTPQPDLGENVVVARMQADSGVCVGLDDVIADLGFDRVDLEWQLAAELAAGSE